MGLANARARMFLSRMGLCRALQAKGRGHSRCAGELQGLSNSRVRDFQELQSCSEGFAGEKGDSQKLSGVFLEPLWAKGGLIGVCGGVPRTYEERAGCCQGFAQLVMETLMDRSETPVGFQGCSQGSAGEGGAFQWFAWRSHGLGICEHEGL